MQVPLLGRIGREERRSSTPDERARYRESGAVMPDQETDGSSRGLNVSIPFAAIIPLITALGGYLGGKTTPPEQQGLQAQVTVLQGHQDDLIRRMGWVEEVIKDNNKMTRRILEKLKVEVPE